MCVMRDIPNTLADELIQFPHGLIARSRTILIILILGESQHSLEVKELGMFSVSVSLITWTGDFGHAV